jgi:HlyD family secretion protein
MGAQGSAMDTARPPARLWRQRLVLAGGIAAGLASVTVALARAKPGVPTVARGAIWIDTVKRGVMLRQVRGSGTLVAEEMRWVAAASPGRVERIALSPGVVVRADTVLLELANPELEQAVVELESRARATRAERERLRARIESDRLAQESVLMTLGAQLGAARFEAEGDEALSARGFGPALAARRSRARVDELDGRGVLERRRQQAIGRCGRAELRVQEAEVARIDAQLALKRLQQAALQVRAGMDGVLQRLGDERGEPRLRVGQQVLAGATLARIADPSRLKAELRIAEGQVKDVRRGQSATIDTRSGEVAGHVVRVDPGAQGGTVTVDVALDEPPPAGARPDLGVDGTITVEGLGEVLHVGRPVGVAVVGPGHLFKLIEGGAAAARVPVRFGRASFDAVEISDGLEAGDRVITSDTSEWDAHDRIRLD